MFKFSLKIISVLIIQFLVFTQIAIANIDSIFSEFYYSPQISSLHCGRNISLFIKQLSASGYDINDIKVLSITAQYQPWSFGRVVAVNARWGNLNNGNFHQNWDFHVIAIIDKKVYDFSFNQTPLILDINQYLLSMFIPKVPFEINGSSFRVGGEGPFYKAEHAMLGLEHYQVKVMTSDKNGKFTTLIEKQNLLNFLNNEIAH